MGGVTLVVWARGGASARYLLDVRRTASEGAFSEIRARVGKNCRQTDSAATQSSEVVSPPTALAKSQTVLVYLPPMLKSGGCDLYATSPGGRLWMAGQASLTLKSGASTRV